MAIKLMPNMNINFVEKKIQFIPDPILYYKGKKIIFDESVYTSSWYVGT